MEELEKALKTLHAAKLKVGEEEPLQEERSRLRNAERVTEALREARKSSWFTARLVPAVWKELKKHLFPLVHCPGLVSNIKVLESAVKVHIMNWKKLRLSSTGCWMNSIMIQIVWKK